MQWVTRLKRIKIVLICIAVVIAISSLVFSNYLAKDLSREEHNKVQVWAEAMRSLNNPDENVDMNLVLTVINGNNTIPVLVQDTQGAIQSFRNIEISPSADTLAVLKKIAEEMRADQHVIRIDLSNYSEGEYIDVCYSESLILKRLAIYPYIQLAVVLIFVIVCIFALLSFTRAEQNRVWVGLSKETAHQLGTPISSLMAWAEILRDKYPGDELIPEMGKDVNRLQVIAERFSKIGSMPEPTPENIGEVMERVISYIQHRTSNKVIFEKNFPKTQLSVRMNAPLFEWVIENLCKNAIDAMDGYGTVTFNVSQTNNRVIVEVSDTGKGIAKSQYKTVFKPGYTTKKRGWGLGLSLAKRIVEEYHKGRIFVKHSELNKGTTFRIELKK